MSAALQGRRTGQPASLTSVDGEVEPMDLERLDLDAFRDRPVAVLGLARSGISLARFLVDRGARVTVYDVRLAERLGEAIEALQGRPVRMLLGPAVDPREALLGQALVCTSPSVSSRYPTTEPRLRGALGRLEAEARVPVVSEVDLFLRLCPALTVGVTGTKGKTTTSSLIAAVLSAGRDPVLLGGNIGMPLIEHLPSLASSHRVVLELSELQLPTMARGTDVAVYTHVTADHLDRHGSLEAYRTVKRRLAELLPSQGALVLNADDPVSADYTAATPPGTALVRYRRGAPEAGEVGLVGGWIVARDVIQLPALGDDHEADDQEERLIRADELLIPGAHNVSNALAAAAVGKLLRIPPEGIRAALRAFTGVEHRLEPVTTIDGVRFINDSQGTQPDAVIAALRSFPRPLVLIAGGRSKGLPMEELAAVAAERIDAAVLMGESGPGLAVNLKAAGVDRLESARDMPEAVAIAEVIARELLATGGVAPATVLLSPAATSFDMFEDYAARGRAFKASVADLAGTKRGGTP
ncbi:MAG: UDP-N-acetylmuramoyl-L-alanine--D-glutamate ligase [Chloroflexota bacterium]|nr:UDP-N-acetylmuramoyl-L-alanine--D-glutamate ligase [Chloroflexota bacterium]